MFKKLKQRISEEQQQLQPPQASAPAQASSSSSTPTRIRSRTSSFTEQLDDVTPNREVLAGMVAEPAFLSEYTIFALDSSKQPKTQIGSVNVSTQATKSPDGVNRSEASPPQSGDTQTFAQKLQLRVPSVESLFRSPIKESLFWSSKESLVRTSSRESLSQLDLDCPAATFDPPSDMESEAEDAPGSSDSLNREQLLQRLRRMERSLSSYRGKYSELVTAYQTLQREKKKLQGILSQSQDKSLRRISELREELQMDQQAKRHLQEEFDACLEEKDQYISVLQTQVSLLKQRLQNGPMSADLAQPPPPSELQVEVDPDRERTEDVGEPVGGRASTKTLEMLQQRVKRQENLLQRCKETIRSQKEQCSQLSSEKEALQEQLDERLQELEKVKELHMAEKTKLITQLRDAKNLIEQLEQDKGMVITETKRQMHETLELKEEEITQLRSRIKQMTSQGEELREQKEKSERAAFEELEKALSTAQKTEEAQRRMKAEMDEQIKAVERASEEERLRLQQELSRVRQEAVNMMKTSEEQLAELQRLHAEELASREQELARKLQTRERELHEQMKIALEKSQSEYLKLIQEKEQQDSLALEELELQKKAILSESENKLQELGREAEVYRTRILELETSLEKSLQESKTQSEHLAVHLEAEKNKHSKELTAMTEKHRAELERLQQQQDSLWAERLQGLTQQHQTAVEQLRKKYEQDKDALLKEKESLFQAHIRDMNEKTLEKLDVKQTELESLSSELAEALKAREQLAEELSVLRGDAEKMKQALEAELEEQRRHHQHEVDSMSKEQEITVQRTEKTLKDELNQLGLLLKERDEHLKEQQARIDDLEAHLHKSAGELQQALAKLDLLHSQQSTTHEQMGLYEEQLAQMRQKVLDLETEKNLLTKQVADLETQEKHMCMELDTRRAQAQQLEEQKRELEEKGRSLAQLHESQLKDSHMEKEETRQILMEKENVILQMREEIEALKQKLSSKEESISILHEEYETKFKNQEKRVEKIKQKAKEMQETKKKLLDQEAKLKKELENTVLELSQKEKQFNAQILEMAQANSAGISDTVSRLEANQKQQIESLTKAHQRKLDDVTECWEKRLSHQAEELRDQHERRVEEKEQELTELKQKLLTLESEKEEVSKAAVGLKEAAAKQGAVLTRLQEQLEQKSAHIGSLSQKEAQLQSQVEKLEMDLGCSLKEKASLEKELADLKVLSERGRLRVSELLSKVQAAEEELRSCRAAQDSSRKSLEDKSLTLKTLLGELASQLDSRCEKTKALLEAKTNELLSVSGDKTDAILSRLSRCRQHTATVREALLMKTGQVSELEAQLKQLTEEQHTLKSSVQQVTHQLEEKENQIKAMKADIEGLVTEKEALQKEGGQQQQAASEKESCITQLKKELSENINAVTLLRGELSEKTAEIDSLRTQLSDLSAQLENSVSLSDKAAAMSSLSKQHEERQMELQGQLQELSLKVDTLSKEKMSALEQVDHWSNKFSEWKKKAQPRFAQYQSTIKDLQTQLDVKAKEAAEKGEQIQLLKEDLDQQNERLECLKAEVADRKNEMETKERDLEAELKVQAARVVELEDCIAHKRKEVESLNEILKNSNQEKDTERNELVQKLQHFEELGEEKDNRVREAEENVLRLEKQVSSLETELGIMKKELEHVSSSVKSRDGELKALEDKLELESASKVELKRKAEQKIAAIRKQLLSQMEEKKQQYEKDTESQLSELNAKLQDREKQIHILEEKLKNLESSLQSETVIMSRSIQNVAASSEQEAADSQGCTHKACEERILALQRRLVEKEKLLHRLEQGTGESKFSLSEMQFSMKLDHTQAKQLDDQILIGRLQEELEEKKMNCSFIASQPMEEETGKNNTGMKQNWASVVDSVQKTLQEKERTCQTLEQKVKELESDLVRERDSHRLELETLTLKYEKSQASQQEMDGKNKSVEILEDSSEENSKLQVIQPKLGNNMDTQRNDLELKLAGAEREKQKLSREVARLQKDLRVLRKEHQQELDILKRECTQEAEEKLKQEQEDLELKHTSILKQLMREFNTQLAQKEQELERTIQETIHKAQEVEAELLESHQEETQQLHRKIAEKDDDLKRTARRYEEILDAREEEMTSKVNDLQTQLEELQKKYEHRLDQEESAEDNETIMELQTQLAQKTTLISDSKLKEQELREQVHNLEDRLKRYEKTVCSPPVGTPLKGGNLYHTDVSLFGEPTEFEYLRKVLFEYMMGRETKTMAKVITTVLKFPDDQAQKILEREDARLMFPSPRSGIF
ncbi:golgin subfamily A member 4 isoform X3 [Cricetulus griseus]|uniref:Golgin subfamily A member 4 isoform X3 n=1 Tax=Cricetulus griseus TaxID=10029 RepID=A0A9J7G1A4_CRIGR|nr:golgin subfamily A member 4 isoform X3 [Cricetulus griseus]